MADTRRVGRGLIRGLVGYFSGKSAFGLGGGKSGGGEG